ncbi:MAG: hypothetical protein JWM96_120 [Alphaproteobacteria bacterium]|nr:hypothetical protein [Alphaproteobacteria bacterium]
MEEIKKEAKYNPETRTATYAHRVHHGEVLPSAEITGWAAPDMARSWRQRKAQTARCVLCAGVIRSLRLNAATSSHRK